MPKPIDRAASSRFLWGVATSAHQIEGDNRASDWWQWESEGHIEGGVRSGQATDHRRLFREDLKNAAALGLTSYRFSVEWARIEPVSGQFDLAALDWYAELVSECERNGLKPLVTLHHFTLPVWVAREGGFLWDEMPARFLAYVEQVIQRIGSRVRLWCTINEPLVLVTGGYLGKFMPPAVFSPAQASQVCRQQLKCHVMAYDLLHARLGADIQVGVAHNMVDFMADRAWHPLERFVAFLLHRFYNLAWLDALTGRKQHFGVPTLMPIAPQLSEARGRRTIDFIGVNYYTKGYVQWRPRDSSSATTPDLPIGVAFSRRGEVQSDLGWAIHPQGFRRMLRCAARYGLPLYVTENGIADQDDQLRSEFLRQHLDALLAEKARGLDIRGYYHWSLLDNFEWIKGFKPRFGLYRVDYTTFSRTLTRSGETYRDLISRFSPN